MGKIVKIILVVIVVLTALYFLVMRGVVSVNVIPNARTLYQGYVEIEPISLSEIKIRLERQGCRTTDYKIIERASRCRYQEKQVFQSNENGIEIYPNGLGYGPVSFYLTEDRLWSDQDIPGSPNPKKFKEAVKKDIESIGNIVKIKEDTYKITKIKYPWTVLY